MAISAKDAIKKFNVELLLKLPLDEEIFFGMAKTANLFPGGNAESIAVQPTRAKKVAYFLQHVVEPGADLYLPKLLEVMKEFNDDNVKNLADEIQGVLEPAKPSEKDETKQSKGSSEFDHAAVIKKLRKQLDKLSSLNYSNMERSLYGNEVITADERKQIKSKVGGDKMEYLIVDIIIPSLKNKFSRKYKAFLEVMEENEDTDLQDTARMLGGSQSVPDDK